jgi:hypothetical protein
MKALIILHLEDRNYLKGKIKEAARESLEQGDLVYSLLNPPNPERAEGKTNYYLGLEGVNEIPSPNGFFSSQIVLLKEELRKKQVTGASICGQYIDICVPKLYLGLTSEKLDTLDPSFEEQARQLDGYKVPNVEILKELCI